MSNFSRSPWIIHYDASSCNGCDIEVLACLTPLYDVERLGVVNTGNPKHADIFLVTGAVNEQSRDVIRNIYHELVEPKVVVAIGICAASGGIFSDCYNISGGVDSVIPVDVYVPGCAARPEAIIDGVVKVLEVLEKKRIAMTAIENSLDRALYLRAERSDAPEILALQKIAYQSEAEIYGDDSLPALRQTLEELQGDFVQKLIIKAMVNGKIIGSIRGQAREDGSVFISRVIVHPYFQGRGIGRRLVEEMEKSFPRANSFEVFTGFKSRANLERFRRLGYRRYKTEPLTPTITWICLKKERQ
jgi:Ni,Fe-hydrogenase III small subunit/N-acetylglutamate synthase-like GNAT family acetyltransferase